ncbi:MAG TPA: hypothetical protein VNC22_18495, partial [Sporichthya sp.]|nr:hypothetical protein [Sporichthya sp.]
LDGIVDAVNDAVSVTGTVPAVLTAAGNLYNTLTSPGSSGLLGSSGPLAIINNDVNAIRTALSPVAAIAQVSPVVTAAQTLLNTSWETSAVSGLVNSTIGGGFLGAGGIIGTLGALSPLAPSSPVGYVNQALSGVLGTVNPAMGVVNGGTGAGTGVLDGLGDTTHGLPLVGGALDGVALPDVLGADSPLNTVNDLLGGDTTHLLSPVTDLLGGADPTGGVLSPVTDLLGGAGAGDPTGGVLSPVTDLLGGAGAGEPTTLLAPVTDALGGVTGGGDPTGGLLDGVLGGGDPTGGITDVVLGDHGVVGGLLGGGDPTGGLLGGVTGGADPTGGLLGGLGG